MSDAPGVAVFASGGGRSVENLARCISAGELACRLSVIVCDRAGAGVLERAERLGIESVLLDPERELDPDAFSHAAFECVRAHDCRLVVLAGFLRLLALPADWHGRVLNIHPALLPAFGGKGYYGDRVHRAVLESGVQFTGCTVHYVNEEYDAGRILLQRCIPVLPEDTVASLGARVFEQERIALPEAISRHFERAGGGAGS
ncbi:MAG: phosphoribosylglycinamide formyltransferase [Planctomycetota bacterium]|nr:phosphoribosylglycinamide formyltransferase [Planctomycetota bacterium]MDP6762944.1 phosphoribosylglycinamide formyltransferase [Planctomycetota bacterium]MDP6987876.1 phosphoribosylglycinamide formyltransferase [Planctomycetota bacterium]